MVPKNVLLIWNIRGADRTSSSESPKLSLYHPKATLSLTSTHFQHGSPQSSFNVVLKSFKGQTLMSY